MTETKETKNIYVVKAWNYLVPGTIEIACEDIKHAKYIALYYANLNRAEIGLPAISHEDFEKNNDIYKNAVKAVNVILDASELGIVEQNKEDNKEACGVIIEEMSLVMAQPFSINSTPFHETEFYKNKFTPATPRIIREEEKEERIFVIYSKSEAFENDAGWWSNEQGWVEDFNDATTFTADEVIVFKLPESINKDATFYPRSEIDNIENMLSDENGYQPFRSGYQP